MNDFGCSPNNCPPGRGWGEGPEQASREEAMGNEALQLFPSQLALLEFSK